MSSQELAAFRRHFQEVYVSEPTPDECQKMLIHLTKSKEFKESYAGTTFEKGAIAKAIELTNQQPMTIGQPDRSKDLLKKGANAALSGENKIVTAEDLTMSFKQTAGEFATRQMDG